MQWESPHGKEEYNSQYKIYGNILTYQSERNNERLKRKRNTK